MVYHMFFCQSRKSKDYTPTLNRVYDLLQIITNLVVLELSSIILLNAVCASGVISSASSSTINRYIFCSLFESVTNLKTAANDFTLSLTIFIPLSSEAFNSRVSLRQSTPSKYLAMHKAAVVFPTPGGPAKSRCGIDSGSLIRLEIPPITSFLLTICSRSCGRYFSTHIKF